MYNNNTQTDDGTSRKKHQLQIDIVMKDSDLKKSIRQKEILVSEIRRLKREQERLSLGIQQKESELQKFDFEILQLDNEVKKLKKELNLL